MKKLILIRHCKAAGQESSAPLTELGYEQAEQLAAFLADQYSDINKIIASPFERAVNTIKPFAEKMGLDVHTDARLGERVLSEKPMESWDEIFAFLEKTFVDFEFKLEGGESSQEATDRAVSLIKEEMQTEGHVIMVSHGNLISLILKYFGEAVDIHSWKKLSNPDVFEINIEENGASVKRIWDKE